MLQLHGVMETKRWVECEGMAEGLQLVGLSVTLSAIQHGRGAVPEILLTEVVGCVPV